MNYFEGLDLKEMDLSFFVLQVSRARKSPLHSGICTVSVILLHRIHRSKQASCFFSRFNEAECTRIILWTARSYQCSWWTF